jgi:hypothetical protein
MAVTKHPSGCQCRPCARAAKARLKRKKRVGISLQTFIFVLIATFALGMAVSVGTNAARPEHAQWVGR